MRKKQRNSIRPCIAFIVAGFVFGCCDTPRDPPDPIEIARKDSIVRSLTATNNLFIDGMHYTNNVHVVLTVDLFPGQTLQYYETDDIQGGHEEFRQYLTGLGDVIIQKSFPGSLWGDTVRTNMNGERVRVPNLAKHCRIFFSRPLPAEEVRDSLMTFYEIRAVTPGNVEAIMD